MNNNKPNSSESQNNAQKSGNQSNQSSQQQSGVKQNPGQGSNINQPKTDTNRPNSTPSSK